VQPLVTVGVPTYNRGETAERAARSALAQDHPAIEVIVSDDASTDDTGDRLARLAAEDPRLRHLRQESNLGHALNFQHVLEQAQGEYFMWLSDDDWIDPGYVSRCLAVLREEPGTVLAAGIARYHSDGTHVVDERPTDLTSRRPGARVATYLARVNVNGALFGVARRDDMLRPGFQDVIGGDWLLVAALAARGRVRTVGDVHIHRSIDGLSSDRRKLGESFGIEGRMAELHHVLVAGRLAKDIATSPLYGRLGPVSRAATAALGAALVVLRFPVYTGIMDLLRRAGLGGIEPRLIALVRSRD
jgi:glycosyltransferase involved in cell wall biosynthesis